jgi:hypothetical protein
MRKPPKGLWIFVHVDRIIYLEKNSKKINRAMSFDQRSRGACGTYNETSRGCGSCTIECRFSNATTSNQPGASSRDKLLLLGRFSQQSDSGTGFSFGVRIKRACFFSLFIIIADKLHRFGLRGLSNMPAVIVDAGLDNFETVLKVSASTPRAFGLSRCLRIECVAISKSFFSAL